ncbi:MAG: penicillin amidase [Candidatus Marinimicrobia bacterium]|nr:penicillin amidase [Candidatus Neomarinimicrobiota bacterium]
MVVIRYFLFPHITIIFLFATELEKTESIVKDSLFSAKIIRDNWGVPHIYGRRDADVAFGLAYAHSQDDFQTIQDVIYALRGDLSILRSGRDAAVNDYYVHSMNFWGMIEERYENEIPEDVKLLCEGYAAGINTFLSDNPIKKKKGFIDVIGEDIIVGFSHRMPFMFGLDGVLKKLAKKKPPEIIGLGNEYQQGPFDMLGSNFMAVAPQRSSDGFTRLWINTHQPWDGPVAWYEAHLISEEGWDFYGALFPGSPVPLIGHNQYLGWSHTVNSPDLIDVYKLTINKQNENQYWFEGYWKDMELRTADIKVKLLGLIPWKFRRTVKSSIHGPVLEFDHGSYAIRISSIKDLRFLEQWYRMGKAQNISEFKKAMKIHAIPMFNTGYADRDGNIYYVYNAKIPKRDPRYNWKKILPGESKRTLWYDYIPYDQLPQVYNPFEGFFQNCNSSPYLATGSKVDASQALPDWTGIETHQTNRALRSLETFGVDPSISRTEFFNYKYDVRYSRESIIANVRKQYIEEISKKGIPKDLEEAISLIKNWDLSADSLNTNAALAILSLPNAFRIENLKYDCDSVTIKVRESVKFLEKNFGRIDVPMGRVFRLIRGKTDLPLSGGPGTLRAIYYKKSSKKYKAIAGDCYIQAIEWGPKNEFNAWSIHQYGSATKNKSSFHYDDQSKLFSKHKMKQIRP